MGIARRLVPGGGVRIGRSSAATPSGRTGLLCSVQLPVPGLNTAAPTRQSCGTALPAGVGSPDSKVSEAVRVFTIAIVRGENSDRSAVGRDTGFGAYVLTACVHRDSRGEFRSPEVSSGRVRPVKTSSSG